MTAPGMARIARWSIAHRWIVVAGWVLLAVAGGLAAARSGGRLSFAFDLPGQPAYQTNTAIAQTFGSGGNEPPLVAAVQSLAGAVPVHPPSRRGPAPFNLSGQPAISLPLHWTPGGLPAGVQLVAACGREDMLIRVAAQLEAAQPCVARQEHGARLS